MTNNSIALGVANQYTVGAQNRSLPVYTENKNNNGNTVPEKQAPMQQPKYLCASIKPPKASTIKDFSKSIKKWITEYIEKPHRYNVDKIEKNTDTILDIIDTGSTNTPQRKDNSTINTSV